jgi:hypothetical protein
VPLTRPTGTSPARHRGSGSSASCCRFALNLLWALLFLAVLPRLSRTPRPPRKAGSLVDAVVPPGGAADLASGHNALGEARAWVRDARDAPTGVFDEEEPLRLQPFEVRFLSRREPPNRWVIDLGKDDDVLIQPQEYHTVSNVEDRLFVAEEHVPLFVEKGWRRQAFPGDH